MGGGNTGTLHGWILASSGIPPEQVEQLKSVAHSLGAELISGFHSKVSVLLCRKVSSPKTKAAQRLAIPLVFPDWLFACASSRKLEPFDYFLLKPLQGLSICVTGLSLELRKQVEEVAISLGADYAGDLSRECSHLVAAEPKGLKYEFALKNSISVVNVQWIWDCKKHQKLVDEALYQPVDINRVETKEDDDGGIFVTKRARKSEIEVCQHYVELMCSDASKELSLIGCRVFLLACTEEEIKRGAYILKMTGATRSYDMSFSLTHIVIGSDNHPSEFHFYRDSILTQFYSGVRLVSFRWLMACAGSCKLVHCASFQVAVDDLVPLDGGTTQMYPSNRNSIATSSPVDRESCFGNTKFSSDVFRGLRFRFDSSYLSDISLEHELAELIENAQGVILQECGSPTHFVCHHGMAATFPSNVCVVTAYWISACVRYGQLLSPNCSILFQPIQWRLPLETMTPCKVTVSGFHKSCETDMSEFDRTRTNIKEIIQLIGGSYLERLQRKHTTHLIVEVAKGEKYAMAIKWGIPVVTLDWLFTCVQSGTRVPIDRFRVPLNLCQVEEGSRIPTGSYSNIASGSIEKHMRDEQENYNSNSTAAVDVYEKETIRDNTERSMYCVFKEGTLTNKKTESTQNIVSFASRAVSKDETDISIRRDSNFIKPIGETYVSSMIGSFSRKEEKLGKSIQSVQDEWEEEDNNLSQVVIFNETRDFLLSNCKNKDPRAANSIP
eukprot:jgi/Galph1/4797/GphlegSOOS_G3443.1